MSRRAVRRSTGGMSLFPFLAVLICTMGALVGLLMLMIARGQTVAASARESFDLALEAEAEAPASPREEVAREASSEATMSLEDAQWRRDMLLQQRKELVERLADRRAEVGYLDRTLRDFRIQAETLVAQATSLKQESDPEALRRELAELERRIQEETDSLEQAKILKDAEPSSYAIFPYDGPDGTKRRPLFVECTKDSVILQPEGIVLAPQDFEGPLPPGNPLDAALRAAQEHIDTHGGVGVHGSPYPLLLVREGGAVAYGLARASMKSWENEFGYELLPENMKLAYPPADPGIADVMRQAVADARQRQIALVAAQPARFAGTSGGSTMLRARPRGGFAAMGGGGGAPARGSNSFGTPSTGSPAAAGGASSAATDPAAAEKVGNTFGGADAEHAMTESSGSGKNLFAPPNQQQQAGDAKSKGAGSDAGAPGGASIGSGAAGSPFDAQEQQPLAQQRGKGWAVPGSATLATPLDRPIRVAIEAGRIVIVPEARSEKAPTQVAFAAFTLDAVGPFVLGVQERVASWGHPGQGFYWSPRLVIEVRPGGEGRYAELSQLLKNSGIEVEMAKR